jgi:hypothetical protein
MWFTTETIAEMRKFARQAMQATAKEKKEATELTSAAVAASIKVMALIENMSAWPVRPGFQAVPLAISAPMKSRLEDGEETG